jgi:hypothetical protein
MGIPSIYRGGQGKQWYGSQYGALSQYTTINYNHITLHYITLQYTQQHHQQQQTHHGMLSLQTRFPILGTKQLNRFIKPPIPP